MPGSYGGMYARAQGLLLTPRPGGAQVTASVPWTPYPLMFEWPAISLFPRRVPVPPARVDVTQLLLRQGFAKLQPEEVAAPRRLARYRAAEQEAHQGGRGVWADATGLLWQAVAADDAEEVRARIAQGADVNARNADGLPLLLVAAQNGRTAALAALLEAGADPDVRVDGWTPLHAGLYTSTHCPTDMAALRNRLGPALSPKLAAMLESAAGPDGGAAAAVLLLVAAGADVPAADAETPLLDLHATRSAPLGAIRLLLARGARLPEELAPELAARAVQQDRPELLGRMLGRGVSPNARTRDGHTLLMSAVAMGRRRTG